MAVMRVAVMRGLTYVGALLVGSTAVRMFQTAVEHVFGTLTGAAAVGYTLVSVALLVVVTAWSFSVFVVPAPRRRAR